MLGDVTDFRRRILAWYDRHRRDLPWRVPVGHPDPYHVLVSEAMLQQTQVATVVPYFSAFLDRFPTIDALAAADEQTVLRAWQGLGYYSRARNLQASAKRIVAEHGGRVPSTVTELLALPGVGRYTAGAVASLAFGVPAPILDGNVARVLCRIDAVQADPRRPAVRELLWSRAEAVLPTDRMGDFNSSLMELGATVCTPRTPRCLMCPVRDHCQAAAAGIAETIPPPKRAKPTPLVRRWTIVIQDDDRYLIEQRPPDGRWAGMWQFVTAEAQGEAGPTAAWVAERTGISASPPESIGQVSHALTHLRYTFDVFRCTATIRPTTVEPRRWTTVAQLNDYPLPRPHMKIKGMLSRPQAEDGT